MNLTTTSTHHTSAVIKIEGYAAYFFRSYIFSFLRTISRNCSMILQRPSTIAGRVAIIIHGAITIFSRVGVIFTRYKIIPTRCKIIAKRLETILARETIEFTRCKMVLPRLKSFQLVFFNLNWRECFLLVPREKLRKGSCPHEPFLFIL